MLILLRFQRGFDAKRCIYKPMITCHLFLFLFLLFLFSIPSPNQFRFLSVRHFLHLICALQVCVWLCGERETEIVHFDKLYLIAVTVLFILFSLLVYYTFNVAHSMWNVWNVEVLHTYRVANLKKRLARLLPSQLILELALMQLMLIHTIMSFGFA